MDLGATALVAVGFLLFLVFGALVAKGVSSAASAPSASSQAKPAAPPLDDTEQLMQRASKGDREAITKLPPPGETL